MSYRSKRQGTLENDIEKAREEGNWKKVIELAYQLKDRTDQVRQHETLGWFLIGEGKLEEYLEETVRRVGDSDPGGKQASDV